MTKVTELTKTENGYNFNDVFAFNRTGVDSEGVATGHFSINEKPKCLDQFSESGISFDASIFDQSRGE